MYCGRQAALSIVAFRGRCHNRAANFFLNGFEEGQQPPMGEPIQLRTAMSARCSIDLERTP
jgi:hypothetical protein